MRTTHIGRYPAPAHTYHYDATAGADTNTGAADKPLQTIADVNARALKRGDRVLFNGGTTWKGTTLTVPSSGVAGRPITFGKYGSGANPIIDPTTEFNDFTSHAGAVWKRTQANANVINQVFEDGVRLIYKASIVTLVSGSWCAVSGVVYVQCSDDGDPNTGHVIDYQAPVDGYEGGIDANGKSYLTFDGIDVTKANKFNYKLWNTVTVSTNLIVRNAHLDWSGGHGVYTNNCNNVQVTTCVAHDGLDTGFWHGRGTALVIEDCESYNQGADVSPNGKLYPSATHFPDGILSSGLSYNCIVRHCNVHHIYVGVGILDETSPTAADHSDGTIIERNLIDNTAGGAVTSLKIQGNNAIARNNKIYQAATVGNGIDVSNTPTNLKLLNNTIISPSNAAHSIQIQSGAGVTVKNNSITRSGTSNRFITIFAAVTGGVVNNNNYYQISGTKRWLWGPAGEYGTFANWQGGPNTPDANGIDGDPVFVTPYTNLHLQVTSPCIGAGDATLGVTDDYDGVARGAAVDIGALEYIA